VAPPHYLISPRRQFDTYDPVAIKSHPGVRADLFKRPLDGALITDFFGGVAQVEVGGARAGVPSAGDHPPLPRPSPALAPALRNVSAVAAGGQPPTSARHAMGQWVAVLGLAVLMVGSAAWRM
jgi:hypothetical protein